MFLCTLFSAPAAEAFCGFYVAKADTELFNQASKVVLVRNDDKTVLTMANDFKGDPKEFAIVIPVPTFIKREQIHVTDKAILEHLDAYSSPRLVEYYDENPCNRVLYEMNARSAPVGALKSRGDVERDKSLGVTVEAEYTVGEYDIVILSAEQSGGLEIWLRESGYRIPAGATEVLGSYIKQKMRFFVAKVNLEEQSELGYSYLRPIQVAYESPKFMLPIRLGTINANGPQELFIFALTRKGRIETTNYRTVKLPSGMDLPIFVKDEFGDFYKAMFDEQVRREEMRTLFLEYAWDMAWCDPCAADPLSVKELRELGVFWMEETPQPGQGIQPRRPIMPPRGGARDVFLTRLHVRYDADHFPEDLVFQETADRTNFQGRYVLRHAWSGDEQCDAATRYREDLLERRETEVIHLASLTGWKIADIRRKMKIDAPVEEPDDRPWWEKIWSN
jgi:hypothetical protein